MEISIGRERLVRLIEKQINSFYEWDDPKEKEIFALAFGEALSRSAVCFGQTAQEKYYIKDGLLKFDPYHTSQYAIFLYYFSNSAWKAGSAGLATKLYSLNKALHCVELFYEVSLPDIFQLAHPIGTVLGRAHYGNFFSCSQNCTVGNNRGIYPVIGSHVTMYSGSSILGDSKVGDHVALAAGALVKDEDIESDLIVFGRSPNLILKPNKAKKPH